MKLTKTLLLSTVLAGGTALALGTSDAHAAETYTVQSGDTLSSISIKFAGDNSLVDKIAADNGVNNYTIYVGEQLTIDTAGSNAVQASTNSYYQAPVQQTVQAPVEDTTVYQAPVQETTQAPAQEATAYQAPVENTTTYQEPVQQATTYQADATQTAPVQETTAQAPVQQATDNSAYTGNSSSAKEWIAQRESGGSYSASNGQYVGRYQLSSSYLNGDYSEANQERVADQYVADRYGSWEGAQSFWQANGWY